MEDESLSLLGSNDFNFDKKMLYEELLSEKEVDQIRKSASGTYLLGCVY
jgi:hypothetical protein